MLVEVNYHFSKSYRPNLGIQATTLEPFPSWRRRALIDGRMGLRTYVRINSDSYLLWITSCC